MQVGDSVLAQPCRPFKAFDDALTELVADMFASKDASDGVGLAANQIGDPLRVFVFDCPTGGTRLRGVVVNPRLEEGGLTTRLLVDDTEGCLSIAGQHAVVPRLEKCDVTGVEEGSRCTSPAQACWPAASSTSATTLTVGSTSTGSPSENAATS